MARTKGSEELFNLVHSLTPEEKGYYKKFARRHIPNGSNYLKLFDAVAAQHTFEEASLREKFKNYAVMKVYLKDYITDGLLLYYKNKHPHVNLFSQIQKIHILLVKGQYSESLRVLKKSIAQSRQMELFSVERYLLRVLSEINHHRLANAGAITEFYRQYDNDLKENWSKENDLTEWELMSTKWFAKVRGLDIFDKALPNIDINSMRSKKALSTRSEIKKLNGLSYMHYLRKDMKSKFETGKQQLELSEEFQREGDPSFNNVYIRNNHITSSLYLEKFDTALQQASDMLNAETQSGFYYHLAFPKSVLFKLDTYFQLGRFDEGLELLNEVNLQMVKICTGLGDFTALKEYYFYKHVFLFVNRLYRECWMDMQSIQLKKLEANYEIDFTDYSMLQLMVQFEMGHYSNVRKMAGKAEAAFGKLKVKDGTYLALLDFFKNVTAANSKTLALTTFAAIKKYYKANKLTDRKAFGLLDYTTWLKVVAEVRYVKDILDEKAALQKMK